jgi:hypothetical protein
MNERMVKGEEELSRKTMAYGNVIMLLFSLVVSFRL